LRKQTLVNNSVAAIVGLPQEEYKIDEIDKLREERTKMYNEKQDILAFISKEG
jgi:hypothetical protein